MHEGALTTSVLPSSGVLSEGSSSPTCCYGNRLTTHSTSNTNPIQWRPPYQCSCVAPTPAVRIVSRKRLQESRTERIQY